ncbi:MAG: DUF2961 domain-containing protein, partial [Candidatus Omnitrophica bacterium]|nr:DUF2961 domain-containing protein [Candidatus Omnitrophota bacterium]
EDHIGRYVIAEATCPGAIVRTWTAKINGKVFLYIDDNPEPVIEGEMTDFLLDTYGTLAFEMGILKEKRLEKGFHQRNASYFPIPFSKSLRVEWEGNLDEIHFYEIEIRKYPQGTEVQPFSKELLLTKNVEISEAMAVLRQPSIYWKPTHPGETHEIDTQVEPGAVEILKDLEGSRRVQTLSLKIEAADPFKAYRQIILKGYFDYAPQPQIEAPLGDFFGAGPGINPYDSVPMTVQPDGTMTCRFPMAFEKSARFSVLNLGDQPVRVTGKIVESEAAWEPGKSQHFFAKWQVDHDIIAGGETGVFDLPFLDARGKGVFVGTAAMILNPTSIPTSGGNWWGEGDEKIWVDGEDFPSFFGTGSEDYFNYAWSQPDIFEYGYGSQPLVTGPDNRGFNVNLRWHILDPIPFQESFDFFMEVFPHNRTPGMSYARTSYFYGTPELRDAFRPINPLDVTLGLELPEIWLPEAKGAAENATFYQVEDLLQWFTGGVGEVEDPMWAGGKAIRWVPSKKGEKLDFHIEVKEPGNYRVVATLGRSSESGRVSLSVNNSKPFHPVVDLHHENNTDLRNFFFTPHGQHGVDLEKGDAKITLTAEGDPGQEILIDFFWLKPNK